VVELTLSAEYSTVINLYRPNLGNKRLRNLIKKILWPLLEKPWQTADMEFHYGLWNGVSALYSEGGRQLGEENTRPFSLNHHLPAETIHCKYPGSRAGRQINMSALRVAMQNFDEALAITGAVRAYHLQHVGSDKPFGIWDLYIIARASIALVAYQKRFARQAAPQATVSNALGSQYQFISGVFMICRHMMENADLTIAANNPISTEALYSYADENGIFVSFNGMACAGSTKKIMEFLNFCNESRDGSTIAIDLDLIVTEPDNWYCYALATIELDCFIEMERARQLKSKTAGQDVDYDKVSDIYRGLQCYCRRLARSLPETPVDGDFRDAALTRQNHILTLLGQPAIVRISKQHIAQRLGL